jgi:hypothetical protein
MHIARTGNVSLLNDGLGPEAWEEIVRRNCIANEVHEYQTYLNALRSHALLVNQYIADKAHINKLMLPVLGGGKINVGSLEYLRNKGYVIDTTTKESYIASLKGALRKRENLMTRINMKKKEIERIALQQKGGKGEDRSVEQLLAALSFQIGFPIAEDVTLARFNEYSRIVRIQQSETQRHGRNK